MDKEIFFELKKLKIVNKNILDLKLEDNTLTEKS